MFSYSISRQQISFHLGKFGFQFKCVCVMGKGKEERGRQKGKGAEKRMAFTGRNPLLLILFLLIRYSSHYFSTGKE